MEMGEIKTRDLYLQKVQPHVGKPVIKVITGHRRSGKSYLLLNIVEFIRQTDPVANIIFINKEHAEFDNIRDYNGLQAFFDERHQEGKNNYFFVDEIQEIDEFEKCIRNILSKNLADIYISGSNADMLSGEIASMLSGRYIEKKIHPLSYREFLDFFGLTHNTENFNRYLRQGGMPGLVNINPGQEPVNDYLKGIYSTVLLKDVVARYNIRNVHFLENLVRFISGNTGSLVSAKNISDYLKSQRLAISPNIVLDYLGYLCNAFLINKVMRKDVEGKKVFEVGEKYYFEDIGLRNITGGFNPADIGKVLENVVYNHLVIAGYEVFVGKQGTKEIDFVAERGGEILYVQVCYLLSDNNVIEREFGNLLAIPDNYRKLVVSMDNWQPGNTYKGIEHSYIPDFCLEV